MKTALFLIGTGVQDYIQEAEQALLRCQMEENIPDD